MCGIAASIDFNASVAGEANFNKDVFSNALRSLNHRGPDDEGVWSADNGLVHLGHARLSIIGLENGRQPLASEQSQFVAVVNGEFYGYSQIRQKLMRAGYTFKTQSDSEIIVPLYQEYGLHFFEYLRGEFAFILYDRSKNQLLFARDRFGIKPLFYSMYQNKLYIASEIKCLFAMGVPVVWDQDALFNRSFNLGTGTMFKGVSSVAPGHYCLVDNADFSPRKYWDFNYPRLDEPTITDEKISIRNIHDALYESVSCRLVADLPVAFYLSGGLDSSAVLGIAADILGTKLPAFTLSFIEDEEFNECKYARLMASYVGADFQPIEITQDLLADNFEEAVWHNEAPMFNSNGVAKYILSREVSKAGYKVVLTGEGADEIFSGYSHFRKDMLVNSRSDLSENLSEAEQITKEQLDTTICWFESEVKKAKVIGGLASEVLIKSFSSSCMLESLLCDVDVEGQLRNRDPAYVSMYLWSKSMLPNFVLTTLGDRMEMSHHIEGRVPFLDHRLVEAATSISMDLKIKNRTEKYVLREAVRKYLPQELYKRKKHYFQAPPVISQKSGKMYDLIQDTLRGSELSSLSFIDAGKVRNKLDQLQNSSLVKMREFEPVLMEIVSLCFLNKKLKMQSQARK